MAGAGTKQKATKRSVSQRAGSGKPNTLDQSSSLKVVAVVFHSDRYDGGECRLYPHPANRPAAARLKSLASKKSAAVGKDPAAHFRTCAIKKDRDNPNTWVCFALDVALPDGKYMLEVPFKLKKADGKTEKRKLCQLVQVRGKFFAALPNGMPLAAGVGKVAQPLVCELIVGDGLSLEEALYNLCSYRYEASIGTMREQDMQRVADGKEPKSGFTTALGVAQSLQEGVAGTIGIVKLDFGFYDKLKKLDQFLGGDRVAKPILALWEKSGIAKSKLNWARELPNVAGLIDEKGNPRERLGTLAAFDEVVVGGHVEALEGTKGFARFEKGVETAGSVLKFIGTVQDTWSFLESFVEARKAEQQFDDMLSYVVKRRTGLDNVPWEKTGYFTRGDMTVLENLKMNADNKSAAAHVEGMKWTIKMSAQAIGFCEYGKLLKSFRHGEKIEQGFDIAKDVVTFADEEIGSNVIGRCLDDLETAWHDACARANNNFGIITKLFGVSTAYEKQQRIGILFLLRAKVLYGLKQLIDMCGPAVDSKRKRTVCTQYNYVRDAQDWLIRDAKFRSAVDRYRIKRYIDELCLSECFWVRKNHINVDWVQHYVQEEDEAHRSEVISATKPRKSGDWFKVDFQKYWPIHFMDHKDVYEFCSRFSTDWSAVSSGDVERCFLQRGKAAWTRIPGSRERALKITGWVNLMDEDVIDSETPVRAVLVFKPTAKVTSGVPVRFQIERTDGFNVAGPVYNTVVRPVSVEEGKSARVGKGRFAAIASFTYSYRWKKTKDSAYEPARVYHGLKPMVETSKWYEEMLSWGFKGIAAKQRRIFHSLIPQSMTMAVKYAVGDGSVEGYASTRGRFFNSTVEVTVQPEHITGPADPEFNRRNGAKFTDLAFLERQVAGAAPPKPRKPALERVVIQYFNGSAWKPVDDKRGVFSIEPVRIVFVLKEKVPLAPFVAQLVRTDTWTLLGTGNVLGPYYTVSTVAPLGALGRAFRGKYGCVITPQYYLIVWFDGPDSGDRIVVTNDGKPWRGIKPVCDVGRFKTIAEKDWKGYTFDVRYGVGTNDPAEATETAEPDDIPLHVDKDIWTGYNFWGIAKRDGKIAVKGVRCIPTTTRLAIATEQSMPQTSDIYRFMELSPNFADIATYARH